MSNNIFTFISLQRKDLLQLLIHASDSEGQKGLEKGEIIADCIGFMLAGYETTSTTLAFATYLLAANPEAQGKLANEIHEFFEENLVSDTETLYTALCFSREAVHVAKLIVYLFIWSTYIQRPLRQTHIYIYIFIPSCHGNGHVNDGV